MKLNLKFKAVLIVSALVIATQLFSPGCGGNEEPAENTPAIETEEAGTPVEIQTVEYQPFRKNLSFFAKLSGIKEAIKGAMTGGKVEKINYKVGDYVEEGKVVVQFELDNPGMQYEQAKSAYENSKKTYERMKALLEAGETSQAQFDGAETKYLVDKRNYEAVRQVLFVEAPFSGIITEVKVNEGDNVKNEAHLFAIAQLNKMRAKVWATGDEISRIKKGMKVFTEYNRKQYEGRVTEVSLAADPVKQAFYAEVIFDNPGQQLKSGETMGINILVYENPQAVIIPRTIVQTDENGMFVYVEENSVAKKRYIQNGRDSGAEFEISTGIQPGDRLIIKGGSMLADGDKVNVIL